MEPLWDPAVGGVGYSEDIANSTESSGGELTIAVKEEGKCH